MELKIKKFIRLHLGSLNLYQKRDNETKLVSIISSWIVYIVCIGVDKIVKLYFHIYMFNTLI